MSERGPVTDLASLDEARDIVADLPLDPGTTTVQLSAARDRVLATRVEADIDVPGFDRASMDGYAVRAADTTDATTESPASLSLVGDVRAGQEPDDSIEAGTAVEIATGAVMPPGADAVVMVEHTERTDGTVEIQSSVSPGGNVSPAGADIAAGTRALGPGTRLSPREIGLLAALGREEITVRARPRVGILPTGDELVRPGAELDAEAGQIYDSSTDAIAAAIEEAGGEPVRFAGSPDDVTEMEERLQRAADECDLVLSTGSTSASASDVIHRVIEDRGTIHLHGVAIKPGKPTIVGELDGMAYVGLPGYPVSALSIVRVLVTPRIRAAAGREAPRTNTVSGTLGTEVRFEQSRHRFLPVGLVEDGDGDLVVYPVDKGSGATTSLANADGIVEMSVDVHVLDRDETVEVTPFSTTTRTPSVLCVGEDDPLFSRLLDDLSRPRFLPSTTEQARDRLEAGVPDVAVVAGHSRTETEAATLAHWHREWGLVVSEEYQGTVTSLDDLIDGDHRFVNLESGTGLRRSFDDALAEAAAERAVPVEELMNAIRGYDRTRKAYESPARLVAADRADVALGLRTSADRLDHPFVSLGTQRVEVLVNEARIEKPGIRSLQRVLESVPERSVSLPGVETGE